MRTSSRWAPRRAGRRLVAGFGLAYALPALAYGLGRPRLGFRKGWLELLDDFAPWLYLPAPGGRLTLFNIHTKIPRLRRSRLALGRFVVPASFHAERRLREVHHFCAMLDATEGPVLAMGDFNMTERSEDHALIAQRLTDAYEMIGRGLGHTFPAWLTFPIGLPLPFPALRRDHIWHSAHFRAVSARIGPSAGSDHHSMIVRLAVTP